ncbi:hypothetical protein V496_09883 [Pseudogymnoascus sp. VKM F-4515 (FW-2607)]|nr:hypothetical protein V496_09883 [Pseudogymnoascus sp. VKM F-4515 (FW-2607)]
MSTSSQIKVLISGATGYIGGSILAELLNSSDGYAISALVRNEEQAAVLRKTGITPVLFDGLDDLEANRKAPSENDVVINAASASHNTSVKAWIEGLSQRQKATGKKAYYIHTSGTSILSDRPITGTRIDTNIYSDAHNDIYAYEKSHPETYSQRVADLAVVATGEAKGVQTYIIVPSTIYGLGKGLFKKLSQQVPWLMRLAIKKGHAIVIGEGDGIWNHVHIDDLSNLYLLLLRGVLAPKTELPFGKKGYYFAETGEHTWKSISEGISRALLAQGQNTIQSDEIESISLKDAANALEISDMHLELALAANSRAKADNARELLGWKPKHGNDSFHSHFMDELAAISKETK